MRLFVAVNFPASVRRSLGRLVSELSAACLPVRWTPEDNFHLTLRWLGERDAASRDVATRVLRAVAGDAQPFEAAFGPVGAFPSPRRPRVIWIAVEAGPRLRLLRDELERRLAADGFGRDERSFRPHVTLGRARGETGPGVFRPFIALSGRLGIEDSIPIESIDLMRSDLGPGGAHHELLVAAKLGVRALPGDDSRT